MCIFNFRVLTLGFGFLSLAVIVCFGAERAGHVPAGKAGAGAPMLAAADVPQPPVGRASNLIRIRRFTGVGKRAVVKTPIFRSSGGQSVRQPDDWAEIRVQYDVLGEKDWLDEVLFHYYVLTMKDSPRGKSYSFYELIVRYVDVAQGKDHFSTALLRPAALKRYGDVVAIGVEISVDGKIVAEDSAEDGIPVGAGQKWWRIPAVVEGKTVVKREGYLLNRAQTPFSLVNIEDFETVKP